MDGYAGILLPSEIVQLASLFPFGPSETELLPCSKEDILSYLPSPEVAWSISETFFTNGEWLYVFPYLEAHSLH